MTTHRAFIVLSVAVLAAACGKSKPADRTRVSKGETSKGEASKSDGAAAASPGTIPDAPPPVWEIKLGGKRPLSGSSVVPAVSGPLTRHNLVGSSATVTIGITNATDTGETGKLHSVHIGYAGTRENCIYQPATPGLSTGLALKPGEGRYELSGDITCESLDAKPPTRRKTSIAGYFKTP